MLCLGSRDGRVWGKSEWQKHMYRWAAAGMCERSERRAERAGGSCQQHGHRGTEQARLLHDGQLGDGSPGPGDVRDMSPYELYGAGFWEWDMSIIKSWRIKERFTTQFRAEFYNLTNTTQYKS